MTLHAGALAAGNKTREGNHTVKALETLQRINSTPTIVINKMNTRKYEEAKRKGKEMVVEGKKEATQRLKD